MSAEDSKILESNGALFSETQNVASDFPLDENQMQTHVSMVYDDVSDFYHNNATFSLIKTLPSKQCIYPEYWFFSQIVK